MKDTIYVIGEKSVFDAEFALFQQGQGWYYENGFSNWGGVRHSTDNQWSLLEELESKFNPIHLALSSTLIFRSDELSTQDEKITQYMQQNTALWNEPDTMT